MGSFQLPVDLGDAFVTQRRGSTTVMVRRDFLDTFEDRGLGSSAATPPDGQPLGGGRGAAWTAPAPGVGAIVVRPGRRGGWPGRLVKSRYLLGHRFLDELVLTERLRRRGAPVPEALAAVQRGRSSGYETWLVTRRSAAQPLAGVLADSVDSAAADTMEEAGRIVGAFHAAGGRHADLNANNVLVGGTRAPATGLVIDLDRGRLLAGEVRPGTHRAELLRLRRSLAKLGLTAGLDAWDRFERGYATGGAGESAEP